MESLNTAFEGRALLLDDDTDFAVDGLMRSRNLLKKWGGEDAIESIGFFEPLLPNTTSKSFRGDQCLESNGDHTKDHAAKSVQSASSMTQKTLMEFGTTFSSSMTEANNEKFAEASASQSKGNLFCADSSVLSSPESSVSTKRVKITNLQSPVPTCQVFGCNKDLSSSKDYHKRHKVCDVHSKTAVVVVNGTRQRFCQQCSRFHVLAEFDEGKRSCRKRLAGHNERRRKPQFNTHLGSTYFTADASNSLIFSRTLPGGFFGLQCNEAGQASQLAVDVKLSQSILRFHGMGKQYPSKNCINAPSSLPELYSSSDSGCALSLLSSQKHNSGMSMARSLISTAQNSAIALGESSSNSFIPLVNNSNGDARANVDSEIPSTETRTLKLKSYLSPQGANTVNLLELSLHLQRVEKQKYYSQIKMENDIIADSTIS